MDGECLKHIKIGYYVVIALIFVLFCIAVMIFRYFLRITREGVILKQNDKNHEEKHHHNEQRINKLEEKNGHEQRQITELKGKVEMMEKIINLYEARGKDKHK